MFKFFTSKKGEIKVCTACAEARGIDKIEFVQGAELSTMKELADLTVKSDQVITF